jgi:hypothetical protein
MIYYILTRNGCFVLLTLTLYVLQSGYDISSEICYSYVEKFTHQTISQCFCNFIILFKFAVAR